MGALVIEENNFHLRKRLHKNYTTSLRQPLWSQYREAAINGYSINESRFEYILNLDFDLQGKSNTTVT